MHSCQVNNFPHALPLTYVISSITLKSVQGLHSKSTFPKLLSLLYAKNVLCIVQRSLIRITKFTGLYNTRTILSTND